MGYGRFIACCSMVVIGAFSTSALSTPDSRLPTPALPSDDRQTLKPFIDKAIAAAGGDRLRAVKAWTVTEIRSVDGEDSTYRRFVQLPDLYRHEFEISLYGERSSGFLVLNGREGWQKRDGEVTALAPDRIAAVTPSLNPVPPITAVLALEDPAYTVTALPQSLVAGLPATGIRLSGKASRALFFDPKTARLVRVVEFDAAPGIADLWTTVSDFRQVDGIPVAYRRSVEAPDISQHWTITSIAFADTLDPKLFARP